jgi:hypothetical protein
MTLQVYLSTFVNPTVSLRTTIMRQDGLGHTTRRVSDWLAGHADHLLIVNPMDIDLPKAAAKLYMTNVDWRKFVFCLIAEASAIVLIVPHDAKDLSRGLGDEMHAIDALGRKADTVVVAADSPSDDPLEQLLFPGHNTDARPSQPQPVMGALAGMGFGPVLIESEVASNPQKLVSAVLAKLKSIGPTV